MTPRIVLEAWQEGCHDAGRGGRPASHGLKLCDAASVCEFQKKSEFGHVHEHHKLQVRAKPFRKTHLHQKQSFSIILD